MDTTRVDTTHSEIGNRPKLILNLHALLFEFRRPQPIENDFYLPVGSPGLVPEGMADSDSIKQKLIDKKGKTKKTQK